uniref:Junction mediating and regulatory protein, p53 cofactor n=1 Tax=Tetraodon nigroviridis TaxID=99883 RepID=H3C0M4_TETNG
SLETERLGPRRVEGLKKEDEEWQKKAHAAVLAIQDLTVRFFEATTRAQKALYERMRADQKKFGKSSWAAAVERMERLQYAVSKETLQLMRAKEICLEQKKHALKEEMQGLQGGEDAMLRLDQMETLYYKLQLQLYDIQAEVLQCEELLLTAQLQSLRRQMTEHQDDVVYYDAFESPDAMKSGEDPPTPPSPLRDEELSTLQLRTRQLEARRGRITAKKVYLKNKKEICIINRNQKIQQRQGSHDDSGSLETTSQREDDEAKRNVSMSQERQRTLEKLRSLRQPCPSLPSQLQTARKKLRKTASLDSSQWRRGEEQLSFRGENFDMAFDMTPHVSTASSPMDEVLASLKRGSFHLRKAELRVLAPDPDDDTNNILAQIRQGVRLKKAAPGQDLPSLRRPADAQIHEALRRIKEASPESESEDEGLPCTDWES